MGNPTNQPLIPTTESVAVVDPPTNPSPVPVSSPDDEDTSRPRSHLRGEPHTKFVEEYDPAKAPSLGLTAWGSYQRFVDQQVHQFRLAHPGLYLRYSRRERKPSPAFLGQLRNLTRDRQFQRALYLHTYGAPLIKYKNISEADKELDEQFKKDIEEAIVNFLLAAKEPRRGPKNGLVISFKHEGVEYLGWSKCHKREEFDRERGIYEALRYARPVQELIHEKPEELYPFRFLKIVREVLGHGNSRPAKIEEIPTAAPSN